MQMRTGRRARGSYQAKHVACFHTLAPHSDNLAHVGIDGVQRFSFVTEIMANNDSLPIGIMDVA